MRKNNWGRQNQNLLIFFRPTMWKWRKPVKISFIYFFFIAVVYQHFHVEKTRKDFCFFCWNKLILISASSRKRKKIAPWTMARGDVFTCVMCFPFLIFFSMMLHIKFDFIFPFRVNKTTKENEFEILRWKLSPLTSNINLFLHTASSFSYFSPNSFSSDSLLLLKFVEIIISSEKCIHFFYSFIFHEKIFHTILSKKKIIFTHRWRSIQRCCLIIIIFY